MFFPNWYQQDNILKYIIVVLQSAIFSYFSIKRFDKEKQKNVSKAGKSRFDFYKIKKPMRKSTEVIEPWCPSDKET